MNEALHRALAQRLARNFGMAEDQAAHVVDEVLDALDRPVDQYIADRHVELQRLGLRNDAIYRRIKAELGGWRFRAPELTERQIRRRIYG